MTDEQRMKHVEAWANYCKHHMPQAQKEVFAFVDSQIEIANAFYHRLAKTLGGLKKIRKLKRLPPPNKTT